LSEQSVKRPDFVNILAEYITDQYESWDKNMNLWASDLGIALGPEHDGCPLRFWLLCRNASRNKPRPGQVLMFKIGDMIHEKVVDLLTRALPLHGWRVVSDEQRVQSEDLDVSGRYDILIEHIETGTRRIVDVKTKRGGAFRYLDKTGAKPGNELQVQFYVKETHSDEGDLLYVDREGQNFMRDFVVPRQDERPTEAAQRIAELRDGPKPNPLGPNVSIRRNKGPDSVYLKEPWQVSYCDLETCPCKQNIGSVPSGIVAKLHDTEEEGVFEVHVKNKHQDRTQQIVQVLQSEYPEQVFVLPEEEEDS